MSDQSKPLTFRLVDGGKKWEFVPQCPVCARELGDQNLSDHLRENRECVPGFVHEE